MATVLEASVARTSPPEASDRSVGLVFAAVFAIIGLFPLLYLAQPRWWALAVGAGFCALALARPAILHPLSRLWLGLGKLLHRIVSPLVMGAIFFLCVTPIGWIQRMRGRDLLSLRRRPDLDSYWVTRAPEVPAAESMKRQF